MSSSFLLNLLTRTISVLLVNVMGGPHQAVCCDYHVSAGVAERRPTKEKENFTLCGNPSTFTFRESFLMKKYTMLAQSKRLHLDWAARELQNHYLVVRFVLGCASTACIQLGHGWTCLNLSRASRALPLFLDYVLYSELEEHRRKGCLIINTMRVYRCGVHSLSSSSQYFRPHAELHGPA